MKISRSKFYSSGDLKQYAKEYKHEKISQFTNQIQNQMLNYNNKYNINYNINQNINQNFTPNKIQNANPIYQNMSSFNQKNFDPNNIYGPTYNNQIQIQQHQEQVNYKFSSSPNDSRNFSVDSDLMSNFISVRPQPKRINSSFLLDGAKTKAI